VSDVEIKAVRVPSRMLIALDIAPLVRLGHLTDAEGRWLLEHRYNVRLEELRAEAEHEGEAV
jgi:hypothetical protein